MNKKEYNGWTNYETWNVNLWLSNEQGTYDYWQEQAQAAFRQASLRHESYNTVSEQARFDLADLLKDTLETESQDMLESAKAQSTMWADLLGAALSEVNWHEIANALLEECEYGEEKYEYAKD